MDARGQRALARRNRREVVEVVQQGPREEENVESDTEEEEILEEKEALPLRCSRCKGSRWTSSSSYSCPNRYENELSMVNVKSPHLSDLEVESMKKFILDYKRCSQKCPRQLLRKMQQFWRSSSTLSVTKKAGILKRLWNWIKKSLRSICRGF